MICDDHVGARLDVAPHVQLWHLRATDRAVLSVGSTRWRSARHGTLAMPLKRPAAPGSCAAKSLMQSGVGLPEALAEPLQGVLRRVLALCAGH